MDLTAHRVDYLVLGIFIAAYGIVINEEFTDLRKSKPVVLAAGLIWALIPFEHAQAGLPEATVLEFLPELAELFMFLMTAMTYVNAMTERSVFEALRAWLVRRAFGLRKVFFRRAERVGAADGRRRAVETRRDHHHVAACVFRHEDGPRLSEILRLRPA